MKIAKVYIAGPMAKPCQIANARRAIEVASVIRDMDCLPFVPHLSILWELVAPRSYEDWMEDDFHWIESCDALFRIDGESPGADREVEHAKTLSVPVFYEAHRGYEKLAQWLNERDEDQP